MNAVTGLKLTIAKLEVDASYLATQVLEAQQKAKATFAVTATASKAQGIKVQVGFKVLRQLLLQLEPSFDMRALKVLITLVIMKATFAEAEADTAADSEAGASEEVIVEEGTAKEVVANKEVAITARWAARKPTVQ